MVSRVLEYRPDKTVGTQKLMGVRWSIPQAGLNGFLIPPRVYPVYKSHIPELFKYTLSETDIEKAVISGTISHPTHKS